MIVEITSLAPVLRLQEARDPAPERAGQRAEHHREQDVQEARQPVERRADPDAEVEPDPVLALAADVEQAGAERVGDRHAGEDQRRREDQRLLEVQRRERAVLGGDPGEEPVEPGALEDRLVGAERARSR